MQKDLAPPLYYAAYTGVPAVVKKIIKRSSNVNTQGGRYGNALQAASHGRHETVVKILMDAKTVDSEHSSICSSNESEYEYPGL